MPSSHHNHPEGEERTPPPSLPKLIKRGHRFDEWPAEFQALIIECASLQERLASLGAASKNWSDKDFTSGLDIATIWPSLRTGTYPFPSQVKTRAKWRDQLDRLKQRAEAELLRHEADKARKARAGDAAQFIAFPEYHAIKVAIQVATEKAATRSEERLIVFKARTRGGKTWLADKLADEGLLNWRVEALPSWKHSYKAMLLSLAEMFALPVPERASALKLETLLVSHIKTLGGVMLFEEVQGLCRDSQEFIKTLLNKSSLAVCVFVTDEAHTELLSAGGNHLAQLFARAETTITASKITPAVVREFDPALWGRAEPKALDLVAAAANALGALSCCRRVTANARTLAKGGDVTVEIAQQAIDAYRRAVPVVSTAARYRSTSRHERRAA